MLIKKSLLVSGHFSSVNLVLIYFGIHFKNG